MRNTGYNKLQLVLIIVNDLGEFSKVGGKFPPKGSRKTLRIGPHSSGNLARPEISEKSTLQGVFSYTAVLYCVQTS